MQRSRHARYRQAPGHTGKAALWVTGLLPSAPQGRGCGVCFLSHINSHCYPVMTSLWPQTHYYVAGEEQVCRGREACLKPACVTHPYTHEHIRRSSPLGILERTLTACQTGLRLGCPEDHALQVQPLEQSELPMALQCECQLPPLLTHGSY